MDSLGVNTIPDYIIKAYGNAEQVFRNVEKRGGFQNRFLRKALEEGTSFEAAGEDFLWTLAIPM